MTNYTKMNRVAFEEKIRAGEYSKPVFANRAIGKAYSLSKEDRAQLKAIVQEHFLGNKSKMYVKIERRFVGKNRYANLSYAERAISRAHGLTKKERQDLCVAAKKAFAAPKAPKPKASTKPEVEVKRSLSRVFFKKRPFFEVFNDTMRNKATRDLISEFCAAALEAEGDGVSLPSIVEAIKRAKTG